MGKPRQAPSPVLLFAGLLYSDPSILPPAGGLLTGLFGPLLAETDERPWHSDYYREELGEPVRRKFLFFDRPVGPGELAGIKHQTNAMERSLSLAGRRRINIDPGYIDLPKLVLASTKDFSHRIYLSEGIYAEVTLTYDSGKRTYVPHAHTYRDYSDERNITAFLEARAALKRKISSLEYLEEGPE